MILRKSPGFSNPWNAEGLATELGLANVAGEATLMSGVNGHPRKACAAELRKIQAAQTAFKHVASGVNHFKAGRNMEAFQALNMALKIDEVNVEALVARGALYANSGSLLKAVDDFEAALKVKSSHKNANKYLWETLVALGHDSAEAKNYDEARKSFEKVLAANGDFAPAKEGLISVLLSQARLLEADPSKSTEAKALCQKVLDLDPKNPEAHSMMRWGRFLCISTKVPLINGPYMS